ncbi:DUF4259 domain-containing protein [Chloroflexota bacterium]
MGAWGIENFENDDALDWVIELESAKDLSIINAAFDAVIKNSREYVDAWESSIALAAAEVCAALNGQPDEKLPEEVVTWVEAQRRNDLIQQSIETGDVLKKAKQAVSIVLADSELRELWEETDEFNLWKGVVADLQTRLDD